MGRIDISKGIKETIEIFKSLKNNPKLEFAIYGIHMLEDKKGIEIYNWLKKQTDIKYVTIDRKKYSPEMEEQTQRILKETDIFIQPYKKLSSTIDTPVLLLEAMASLCVVITKPFGNILEIYGKSKFLIPEETFVPAAINLLQDISSEDIEEERKRIYQQNQKFNFRASEMAIKFLQALGE